MDESAIADSPPPTFGGSSSPRVNVNEVFTGFDVEAFDWSAFESTYRGRALITRLLHIPKILLSKPATTDPKLLQFARTAILRAVPHIKHTWDTNLYLRVMSQYNETLGRTTGKATETQDDDVAAEGDEDEPMADSVGDLGDAPGNEAEGELDMAWVRHTREAEKKEVTRTDVELRGYMSNLIKESIRLTHLSFARMAANSGKIGDIIKHHAAAREYASSPIHHVEQGVSVIEACLPFNNTTPLAGVLGKVEAAADRVYSSSGSTSRSTLNAGSTVTANDVREHRERDAKAAGARKDVVRTLRIANGLLALDQADFKRAGGEFAGLLEEGGLGPKEGEGLGWPELMTQAISTSDVALITAMCILATGSRDTIRDVLLNRSSFRSAVDDTQQWLLDAVRLYADAQYGEMRSLIQTSAAILTLNPFLSQHVQALSKLITTRAIVQYIQPFSAVSLSSMSSATGIAVDPLLSEIEDLLEKGKLKGKIDLIDKILHVPEADPRKSAYRSAFKVGSSINTSTRAAIIRMRLQEAKIEVDPRPKDSTASETSLGPADSVLMDKSPAQAQELPTYSQAA